MRSSVPWVVALVACALATWSWLRPRSAPASGVETRANDLPAGDPSVASGDTSSAPSLATTRVCLDRLERARSALRRCQLPRQPGTAPAASARRCMSDPQVEATVERRIDDAIADHIADRRALKMEADARQRSAFDEWAEEALALTPEQSEWMEEFVCAARQLRQQTLASLDETPPVEALQRLKAQRQALLGDLRALLGAQRYDDLRAVGGIGLVADTTECP